jgi:hypothetical protein
MIHRTRPDAVSGSAKPAAGASRATGGARNPSPDALPTPGPHRTEPDAVGAADAPGAAGRRGRQPAAAQPAAARPVQDPPDAVTAPVGRTDAVTGSRVSPDDAPATEADVSTGTGRAPADEARADVTGRRAGAVAGQAPDAGVPDDRQLARREWWERLGDRSRRWTGGRGRLLAWPRTARAVFLWAGLAWLITMYVTRPELRDALQVAIQVYAVLLIWFALARTRTVSWRLIGGVFAVGIVWAFVVAAVTLTLAEQAGTLTTGVTDLGPRAIVAGIGEESLKLLPLLLLAVVVPGRVRRFAVADWLLLGVALGLAFQLVSELARRTYVQLGAVDVVDLVLGPRGDQGPWSGFPQYAWGPLSGGSAEGSVAAFPGHHVLTGLTAACIGLGVLAWQHTRPRPERQRSVTWIWTWRTLAVALPIAAWWASVSVHAGYNATRVEDGWTGPDDPSMPWLLRAGWTLTGHGFGLGWVLIGALVAAVLLDARRLRAADDLRANPLPYPFTPAVATDTATRRLVGWAVNSGPPMWWLALAVEASLALTVYVARDLCAVLLAHVRAGTEPRHVALARGRAAGRMVRAVRADAMRHYVGPDSLVDRWLVRVTALAGMATLLAATLWLAPTWATSVDDATATLPGIPRSAWLAGLFDSLGTWWDDQGTGGRLVLGLAVVALVGLAAGSLGQLLPPDAAAGQSRLARLRTVTPHGAVLNLFASALTFAPGQFARSPVTQGVQASADEFAADPAEFLRRLQDADTEHVPFGPASPPQWLADLREGAEWQREEQDMLQGEGAGTELYATQPGRTGYHRLDGYRHGREVLGMNDTQLGFVRTETAFWYLRELDIKYPATCLLADVPEAPPELVGARVIGDRVLVVPVQLSEVPAVVLVEAARLEIRIRDVEGAEYA